MPINFSTAIYLQVQNVFGRSITLTPRMSQPNAPAYSGRGIFDTRATDVVGQDGTIFSEQQTILDIRDAEYPTMPVQGDHVSIPEHMAIPGAGDFRIIDLDSNGGGETTLVLRKLVQAKPWP